MKYLSLSFNVATDRLISLADVAQVAHEYTGLSYVVVLWKEMLPQPFLWRMVEEPRPRVPEGSAPTWS
jgi:hypothetical protein